MVMGVSLSPALGRWFRHAIPFAILTLLLLYISIWFFYEWPFPLPAQRTQQSGLRGLKLPSPSPVLGSLLSFPAGVQSCNPERPLPSQVCLSFKARVWGLCNKETGEPD
jgi:hypothetical protein